MLISQPWWNDIAWAAMSVAFVAMCYGIQQLVRVIRARRKNEKQINVITRRELGVLSSLRATLFWQNRDFGGAVKAAREAAEADRWEKEIDAIIAGSLCEGVTNV